MYFFRQCHLFKSNMLPTIQIQKPHTNTKTSKYKYKHNSLVISKTRSKQCHSGLSVGSKGLWGKSEANRLTKGLGPKDLSTFEFYFPKRSAPNCRSDITIHLKPTANCRHHDVSDHQHQCLLLPLLDVQRVPKSCVETTLFNNVHVTKDPIPISLSPSAKESKMRQIKWEIKFKHISKNFLLADIASYALIIVMRFMLSSLSLASSNIRYRVFFLSLVPPLKVPSTEKLI